MEPATWSRSSARDEQRNFPSADVTILETATASDATRSSATQSAVLGRDHDDDHDDDDDDDGVSTAYLPAASNASPASAPRLSHADAALPPLRDSQLSLKDELFPRRRSSVLQLMLSQRDLRGVLINYAAVGVVHGLLQSLVYPFLKIYLNMLDYQAASAETLVSLPWSFKLLVVLASDCFLRRRRRPLLLGGWAMCLAVSLVLVSLRSQQPYLQRGNVANRQAADAGPTYIALFFFLALGLVVSDATADAVLLDLASRRPRSERSGLLLACLTARYAAQGVVMFLVAFLCQSEGYGGSFGWGASVNGMMVAPLLAALAGLGGTWAFVRDCRSATAPAADNDGLAAFWGVLQHRSVWQLMVFVVLTRVGLSYYASTAKVVYEFWLAVDPLVDSLFNSFGALSYAAAAASLLCLRSRVSWRCLLALAVAASVVLTVVPAVFAIWNVVRSSFLVLLIDQLVVGLDAVAYLVTALAMLHTAIRDDAHSSTFIAASPRLSAAPAAVSNDWAASTFALLVSLANASAPMAVSLSQSIGAHFDGFDSDWRSDSSAVRARVFYAFLVWLVVRLLLGLGALPLLPRDPSELHHLQTHAGSHRRASIYVLAASGFVLLWSFFTAMLSVAEATACLTVAGGEGC
ncbi:hypothetical protein P43SY_005087 [Pythium insidiosum]|uniref:Transmembrane protein n=1 Tax=Pythium insidiosum TaxID=114742 RepID=A0AAD5M1L7_PYTIN|nr:hypothetical protein P43SY_005087 [Pythium insidiosum]